ncbi:hypothetical protein AEYBE204_02475 [Asticcacaulis sp. YBE204]|nr:hypothetical protein AEYBE204_02475 [Asticcacaulis sp. YBE204]
MTVFVCLALLFGGFVGYEKSSGGDLFGNAPWVIPFFTLFLIIGGLGISILWWQAIDEAQREAHKWAWYWGGSSGILLILPLFLTVRFGGDAAIERFAQSIGMGGHYFELGMLTVLGLTLLGYSVAWIIWWIRHR